MRTIFLWLAAAGALAAQTPAFDVASVKPNKSLGGMSSIHASGGRISMENVSLKKVTLWAYGIPDDRDYALVGPSWLANEHFDIDATFPANTTAEQVRKMTQALLAERFKLALHPETRQLSTYVLVTVKDGPKIHAVEEGEPKTSGSVGHFEATRITMQKFTDLLPRQIGAPVTNSTGMTGAFSFTLTWVPEEAPRTATAEDAAAAAAAATGPTLFAALQDQLGLKLEGKKGPVDVLVIDHMEKVPTQN
jgi:uncharacterized protein (TIGR03435 family)